MSNNLEPKKSDRLEKPFEPDVKKGGTSSAAPTKPQVPPPPPNPKSLDFKTASLKCKIESKN